MGILDRELSGWRAQLQDCNFSQARCSYLNQPRWVRGHEITYFGGSNNANVWWFLRQSPYKSALFGLVISGKLTHFFQKRGRRSGQKGAPDPKFLVEFSGWFGGMLSNRRWRGRSLCKVLVGAAIIQLSHDLEVFSSVNVWSFPVGVELESLHVYWVG